MAIGVLTLPILTRLFTPEDFGGFAAYVGIFAPLVAVGTLRLDMALPLPETDEEATSLVAAALLMVGAVTATAAVAVTLFAGDIATWAGVPALEHLLWWVPVGVPLGGLYQVMAMWATRKRAFKAVGRTKFEQAGGTLVVQLVSGIAGFGPGGLIAGEVVGRGAGSWHLFRTFPRLLREAGRKSWGEVRSATVAFSDFLTYSTPSTLISLALEQAMPFVFVVIYDVGMGGSFAVATRVLTLPAALVGRSVGQVFLKTGADAAGEGTEALRRLYRSVGQRLAQVGVAPFIAVAAFGMYGFAPVFGPEWEGAGVFVAVLAAGRYVQFVVSPLTAAAFVMRKQGAHLAWDATRFVAFALTVLAAAEFDWSPVHLAISLSALTALSYAAHVVGVLALLRLEPRTSYP